MTLPVNESLFKAFIWNAVQLKQSSVSAITHQKYMSQQYSLGLDILDVKLPVFFKSSSLIEFNNLYRIIGSLSPTWSNKLPYVAAFGYTQGILIHELRSGDEDTKESVGLSSSIFNICISLFDYIVDELPKGRNIFKIITYEVLLDLMDLSKSPDKTILLKDACLNKLEWSLAWFVFAFSISCRLLHRYSKNDEAWEKLSLSVFRLYCAEKLSCRLQRNKLRMSNSESLMKKLRYKSVVPSISTFFISQVACASSLEKQENKIEEICETIGSIFWISDDLGDNAKDLKSGTLSYITVKMLNIPHDENLIFDEESFYEVLISFIEYLLNLLQKLDEELKSISGSTITYSKVMEYVQMYVTSSIVN